MRSEWDDPRLIESWTEAMGDHGDYWRQALINPLVLSLAERIARGADPFAPSVFEALLGGLRADRAGLSLDGLMVADLGCGEACLGRLLSSRGARYLGVDSSEALLAVARQRAGAAAGGRMILARADLEKDVASGLTSAGAAGLVTGTVLLDHLDEVSPLLGTLATWLRGLEREIPVLFITLAPDRFELPTGATVRPGELTVKRRAIIECCQREVTVWLRSRRTYERGFRDAGLFVRRCEPLFFHRQHAGAAIDQREDPSRRPVFWAWLLSARRGHSPPPEAITWPERSDAAALRASAEAVTAGKPGALTAGLRVYDFRRGQHVIRVHNMGGELYAVLAGSAKMMDGSQELMTFRAGEVLGDLETTDACGQCGSFPFDVVAGEDGCRVALLTEESASAVLASSRDIGSRFFRLLRDRLRLALWHYDIRELVGEYLDRGSERLEKRLLHRCARALLWAAAIESRGRTAALGEEIAFLDPDTIARRFKPGTERIDFGVVIRQLHLLRMIDAFPGAALRKEEEARATASWDALVAGATRMHLLGDGVDAGARANIQAHAGRLRVSGQLTKDGNRTRQFQDVVDDLTALSVPLPGWRERVERWSAYVARAHRFWEDRNPWLIVLRDVPALRRIALGDAAGIEHTLGARAEYLLTDARRPTWELVTAQAFSARRKEYIAVFDELVAADLAAQGRLAFSSDTGA